MSRFHDSAGFILESPCGVAQEGGNGSGHMYDTISFPTLSMWAACCLWSALILQHSLWTLASVDIFSILCGPLCRYIQLTPPCLPNTPSDILYRARQVTHDIQNWHFHDEWASNGVKCVILTKQVGDMASSPLPWSDTSFLFGGGQHQSVTWITLLTTLVVWRLNLIFLWFDNHLRITRE